jgi:hypothetical protein
MTYELPKTADGWIVDYKLQQFRKVEQDKDGNPEIKFLDFNSYEGANKFEEMICRNKNEHGLSCTMPLGHKGDHVAHGVDWFELNRWNNDDGLNTNKGYCFFCGEPDCENTCVDEDGDWNE